MVVSMCKTRRRVEAISRAPELSATLDFMSPQISNETLNDLADAVKSLAAASTTLSQAVTKQTEDLKALPSGSPLRQSSVLVGKALSVQAEAQARIGSIVGQIAQEARLNP